MRSKAMRDKYMNKLRTNFFQRYTQLYYCTLRGKSMVIHWGTWVKKENIEAVFICLVSYLKKIIRTTSLKVIGDRFLKADSSLCIPSLYITVSVKNNKRLFFLFTLIFLNTKFELTENSDTLIVPDFQILWLHKRPLYL